MIYCVEDDDDIRELMLYTLRTAGFEAQGFPDSVLFWKAMEEEQPKLIHHRPPARRFANYHGKRNFKARDPWSGL